MPNISYLITCHNESKSLDNLLKKVFAHLSDNDEVVILDDNSDNPETLSLFKKYNDARLVRHSLNNNYGEHKNFGNLQCKNEWIFQLDSDELPTNTLLSNIKEIININLDNELFYIPRFNNFIGVLPEHAQTWGWNLSICENIINTVYRGHYDTNYIFLKHNNLIISEEKFPNYSKIEYKSILVNRPDYQGRLYKNIPDRIKWNRRLHEKIEGIESYSVLPNEYEYCIIHEKTIETQIETNKKYNILFSKEDNEGFKLNF